MANNLYKSKATPKPQKPKAPPPPSHFEYEPYITRVEREMNSMDAFLKDMREDRVAVNPQKYGLETAEEVYNAIVDSRNLRAKILRNWRVWVELSAPVTVTSDTSRTIVLLNEPNCYWYEPDLENLNETSYTKRIISNTGKWRDIINLRGMSLVGDTLQASILRRVYITVMTEYTRAHGFKGVDNMGMIIPHDNWREKLGSYFIVDGRNRIEILK